MKKKYALTQTHTHCWLCKPVRLQTVYASFQSRYLKIAPTKTYHKKTGNNLKVKGSQRPQEIPETLSVRIPRGDTLPPHPYSLLSYNHWWVMRDSIYEGGVPLNLQMTNAAFNPQFGSGRLPLNFQPPHYRQFSRTSPVASSSCSSKWKCHPLTQRTKRLHISQHACS